MWPAPKLRVPGNSDGVDYGSEEISTPPGKRFYLETPRKHSVNSTIQGPLTDAVSTRNQTAAVFYILSEACSTPVLSKPQTTMDSDTGLNYSTHGGGAHGLSDANEDVPDWPARGRGRPQEL